MAQPDEHPRERPRGRAAISLRGVVKRFGEIVAVDGLDLEVPPGVCFGLLGPNGAGKSTTMRMLTAQTLADEGAISVLGYELPRESKQSRLEMGVVPQLDNLDVELTCRQMLTVFARLYRVPRARARGGGRAGARDRQPRAARGHDRARALGRDAPAAARRARADPPAAPGAARRADGGPRPAGPPGAVVADRRPARGRRDGADEHPLHRGGRAPRGHRGGDVGRADHRAGHARGARAARTRASRCSRSTGRPSDSREVSELAASNGWASRRSGPAVAILRAETLDGGAPEGVRRPANLEDAFVALTGEEIE